MNLDHEAIIKAYPEAAIVDDDTGAFKQDGTKITLDQSVIDAARVELNKLNYRKQRTGEDGTTDTIYPDLGEQLDLLFKAIDADSDLKAKFADFHTAISAVKSKYPKPN